MPSAAHETPLALAKLDPFLVSWLLTDLFQIKLPAHHHARDQPTEVRKLVPSTLHADAMLLFCDLTDQPLYAVVFEVQRGWDDSKHRTWKLYVAQLESEVNVSAVLIVYCPSPALADRYRDLFADDGISLQLRPFIFTPQDVPVVTDVTLARANPALAALSAICHGDRADLDNMFPGLLEALRTLGTTQALKYYDIVLAGLPSTTRPRWEAFVTTTAPEYHSDLFRSLVARYTAEGKAEGEARGRAEGRAEGEARGEAQAVLRVLETRGVTVPTDHYDRILYCTDLDQLDTWLRRAITATTIDDVMG